MKLRNAFLGFALGGFALSGAQADDDGKLGAGDIRLEVIGTYATGIFDDSAAEIAAYDSRTQRLFITNDATNMLDVLDISDPTAPGRQFGIDLSSLGSGVNSVAVRDGVVAVAVEADPKQDPGTVGFFDTDGNLLNSVQVGALPDMLTFTPNGRFLLVANEGEPNEEYTIDPEGSVSIITMRHDVENITQADVRTAAFTRFNERPIDPRIRIFGPGATVAQDLEPEYIAVSRNSRTAWVALQENNALAIVNIPRARVRRLVGLGFKDHSVASNGLDASNRDGAINIQPWPVHGMFQPDGIASFKVRGREYLISANEGDARDYDGFSEEARVGDLILDPDVFPDAATLQQEENLGRLKTTTASGDTDGDGHFEKVFSYGGRSYSIWDARGRIVFDSGSQIERVTANLIPDDFNSNNDENDSFDSRSDDKGPEPEGVTVGRVGARTYAFVGLERVGGVVVVDVSYPTAPRFVEYVNNRDFTGDAELGTAGDLGPEGLLFIRRRVSPINAPLLVVTNEVSGTTTIYKVNRVGGFGDDDLDDDLDDEEDDGSED